MSTPTANSFNPAFLESLKKKSQNTWRCPACYAYNDNKFNECRSCEAKKPGTPAADSSSVKRMADAPVSSDEKKPKVTGFVFKPSGNPPAPSLFGSTASKPSAFSVPASFPTTFKFGVGANAVTLNVPAPPKKQEVEEKKKEEEEEDCMKYESDEDSHGEVPEQDYSEDEKAVDVMEGREDIPYEECTTMRSPLSKNCDAYDVYVFGSGDCGQLGLGEDEFQVWYIS